VENQWGVKGVLISLSNPFFALGKAFTNTKIK
jgi:hypothetical protein